MSKKISKTEVKEEIEKFFKSVKTKTPKEVKKIKKLAMKNNLQLREHRKEFCKKCFTPYKNPKIRIKNELKSVTCNVCGFVDRWRLR